MLNDTYYGKTSSWGMGVVEDIRDPEQAGRVRVRVYGIHTPDKALIPTEALPWSQVVMPVNSASQSGVGTSPVGIQVGSLVYGNFLDSSYQQFLVLGSVPGKKASTDVQVVESEPSVQAAAIEEFGLSASEQVYNIARAEGLSENMAAGLLAAISDNADFTNLFDQSSDRFSDYSEFALGLLSPLEDLKTQTLYIVKKISGVTFFEAAVSGGGRTQKPISSPGDAATAISQQFYGTVSEELKTYAEQASAAYSSNRTEGGEGVYQVSAGAEEDTEFPYLRSVEHIISYMQHGRDSRINTDNRIKGLWISATNFEGDAENNRRVPFYDAEFQKLTGNGVQTHLYILRDGSLQTGLHIEEVPSDNIVTSERVTEDAPERLRDFIGELFNLGGGETGNEDNLDFDKIFEQTLIKMLKDYRADGNPIPTLTSGTRTAEEQADIRGQVDFAAGRNLSRHERYQAVDFREVDTRRMEEGGYLDRYDLWRRYKDNGDPFHIEERGVFRDPPEEWPFPGTSTITRSIQNSVLTINFVGMRRVGASGYTTAQWETFEALIQAYLLVFPEGNWVSTDLQYPIKGHIDSRYSDYSGVASEIEQPAALAAAPIEAQDPAVEESLPSEEPEAAAIPTDTSDVESAPAGPITLPTIDPLNFPTIPSPDDTSIISIGDLLGGGSGGSGGTATGGNADTLNNQPGSYYLNFNNFTNLPSPTLTVTGDASGTATFNSLGDATLNLTVSASGGTLNATGTPVDNQLAVWTAADTLEGDANLTWDGTTLTVGGDEVAVLASPAFTGTPTAPTATAGTNTTQLATTAFVQQEIIAGGGSSQITYTRSTAASSGVAYQFSSTTYAGGEFVIVVHDTVAGERQIVKLLITHDGTDAYVTEYGSVETSGAALATFSTNIASGNVQIVVLNASANTTKYIIQPTLLLN